MNLESFVAYADQLNVTDVFLALDVESGLIEGCLFYWIDHHAGFLFYIWLKDRLDITSPNVLFVKNS